MTENRESMLRNDDDFPDGNYQGVSLDSTTGPRLNERKGILDSAKDFIGRHKAATLGVLGLATLGTAIGILFPFSGKENEPIDAPEYVGTLKNREVEYNETPEGWSMEVDRGDGTRFEFYDTVDFDVIPATADPKTYTSNAELERIVLVRKGVEPINIDLTVPGVRSWAQQQYEGLVENANSYANGMRREIVLARADGVRDNVSYFEKKLEEDFPLPEPAVTGKGVTVPRAGTVDDEKFIREIISKYGADEIRSYLKEESRPKYGPFPDDADSLDK